MWGKETRGAELMCRSSVSSVSAWTECALRYLIWTTRALGQGVYDGLYQPVNRSLVPHTLPVPRNGPGLVRWHHSSRRWLLAANKHEDEIVNSKL